MQAQETCFSFLAKEEVFFFFSSVLHARKLVYSYKVNLYTLFWELEQPRDVVVVAKLRGPPCPWTIEPLGLFGLVDPASMWQDV